MKLIIFELAIGCHIFYGLVHLPTYFGVPDCYFNLNLKGDPDNKMPA